MRIKIITTEERLVYVDMSKLRPLVERCLEENVDWVIWSGNRWVNPLGEEYVAPELVGISLVINRDTLRFLLEEIENNAERITLDLTSNPIVCFSSSGRISFIRKT